MRKPPEFAAGTDLRRTGLHLLNEANRELQEMM